MYKSLFPVRFILYISNSKGTLSVCLWFLTYYHFELVIVCSHFTFWYLTTFLSSVKMTRDGSMVTEQWRIVYVFLFKHLTLTFKESVVRLSSSIYQQLQYFTAIHRLLLREDVFSYNTPLPDKLVKVQVSGVLGSREFVSGFRYSFLLQCSCPVLFLFFSSYDIHEIIRNGDYF